MSDARIVRPSIAMRPLPWMVVLGYFVVFLLLDWASFIRPVHDLNITPWNPQPALAVALLLASRRLWWVVLTSLLAADLLVRGLPRDLFIVVAAAAALTCSYLAIASALHRALGRGWRLSGRREVGRFIAVVAAGALLSGLVYVGTFAAGGWVAREPLWEALARYWVGDAVGMVVALPIALAAMDATRRDALLRTLARPQWWAIVAAVALLLWLLFGRSPTVGMDLSFLLLLPVIWAASRFGAAGALLSAAVTQIGLIVAVQAAGQRDVVVFELQLLMAAVTIAGLLLGVIVDERLRADQELRRSLRLAAAGQMSAALAHELSQPLTALATYAQACEMLAPPDQAQLREVAQRIAQDTKRAGDVVRRLRDFFASGATQLARTDMGRLVADALAAQSRRAEGSGIALRSEWPADLPQVWVDAVQLEVVLRNLVANAIDAAQERARPPPDRPEAGVPSRAAATEGSVGAPVGEVVVRGSRSPQGLLVEVIDSGPGVPAAAAQSVFEPGHSAKVGGMGVGLSICRAIVEAHGGQMWVEPGARGHFCFTLPIEVAHAS